MAPPLPAERENQTYVTVQALSLGCVSLPNKWIFQDTLYARDDVRSDLPFIGALITHPTRGKALYDLGIRKDITKYPPKIQFRIRDYLRAWCDEDAADVLRKGGIEPSEINTIILSHLHWDHVGDPEPFTSAEFVVGAACKSLLETAPNSPFATFERAFDFYGDGALYIVDTPGHLPGHVAAAARVAPNTFVLLAGDSCHHRDAYNPGTRLISELTHHDLKTAQGTVNRLVELYKTHNNAIIVLAHESERMGEMPFFPLDLKEWAIGEVEKRKASKVAGKAVRGN